MIDIDQFLHDPEPRWRNRRIASLGLQSFRPRQGLTSWHFSSTLPPVQHCAQNHAFIAWSYQHTGIFLQNRVVISTWAMFCFTGWASRQSGTPFSRIRTTSSWICCHELCYWWWIRSVRLFGRCSLLSMESTSPGWVAFLVTNMPAQRSSFDSLVIELQWHGPSATPTRASLSQTAVTFFSWYVVQAGVYFDEITAASGGLTRFVPRSVQIDLESGVCNSVSALLSALESKLLTRLTLASEPIFGRTIPSRYVPNRRAGSRQ